MDEPVRNSAPIRSETVPGDYRNLSACALASLSAKYTRFSGSTAYRREERPNEQVAVIDARTAGGYGSYVEVHGLLAEIRFKQSETNSVLIEVRTPTTIFGHKYSFSDEAWTLIRECPPGSGETKVPTRLSVASILKSKGLGSPDCVHPSDLETYLRLYAPAVDSHSVSVVRTPWIYRPRGFTVVLRYEFPGLTSPVPLRQWTSPISGRLVDRLVVKPGQALQACEFSQSDAETPSNEVVKNACVQVFQIRNSDDEESLFGLIDPIGATSASVEEGIVSGGCSISMHGFK